MLWEEKERLGKDLVAVPVETPWVFAKHDSFPRSVLSAKRGILINMPSLKMLRFVMFIDSMSFLVGCASCFAADVKIKTLFLPILFPTSNSIKKTACASKVLKY